MKKMVGDDAFSSVLASKHRAIRLGVEYFLLWRIMLYLTVNLFGKNGIRGEFREYEAKALALFRKHGGEVVVAFAPASRAESEETPDEIQVLRISDQSKFEAFMNDPDRLEMAEERISVIRKTEVFLSEEVVEY